MHFQRAPGFAASAVAYSVRELGLGSATAATSGDELRMKTLDLQSRHAAEPRRKQAARRFWAGPLRNRSPVAAGCAVLLVLAAVCRTKADDSAASVAAGGIHLVRSRGIVMKQEVLRFGFIGGSTRIWLAHPQVRVAYEFLNVTRRPITTEVAFPVPPYDNDQWFGSPNSDQLGLEDFKLSVNGRPHAFQIQVRAMVGSRDVTVKLRQLGVDIADFRGDELSPSVKRLSPPVRQRLKQEGILDDIGWPAWSVAKLYYWKQTFPPGEVVRIAHEYTPIVGAAYDADGSGSFTGFDPERAACAGPRLADRLQAAINVAGDAVETHWIDFILLTAKNWGRPIGKFQLEIDKEPAAAFPKGEREYLSFCWPYVLREVAPGRFVSTVRNFVPRRNLHIGFYDLGPCTLSYNRADSCDMP